MSNQPLNERSNSVGTSYGYALDFYVFHLPCNLVHPNPYSLAIASNVEYKVVHVGYGVEVKQELGIGKPTPYGQ